MVGIVLEDLNCLLLDEFKHPCKSVKCYPAMTKAVGCCLSLGGALLLASGQGRGLRLVGVLGFGVQGQFKSDNSTAAPSGMTLQRHASARAYQTTFVFWANWWMVLLIDNRLWKASKALSNPLTH